MRVLLLWDPGCHGRGYPTPPAAGKPAHGLGKASPTPAAFVARFGQGPSCRPSAAWHRAPCPTVMDPSRRLEPMRKATREDEAERPPATPGGGPRVRDVVLAALLIAAVVVAVFRPVLHAQALGMDDADFVTGNTLVTNPGWASAERFFTEVRHPSTVRGYYLPVTMTSLMLDWAMGGRDQDLATFHRTNLVLHGVSTILVFLLLVR